MIKNIFSLAIQGLRRRKKQSLLIFSVLLISFAFAIMLLSYSGSITATNSQLYSDTFGIWYGAFTSEGDSDGDRAYLESTDWADEIGVSVNYGTAFEYTDEYKYFGIEPTSSVPIGTIDDTLVGMGIRMQSGHMPTKSDEIAVESSVLSQLGLSSSLNQNITLVVKFVIGDKEYTAVKDFKLCGIISSYTSIWDSSGTLNSAIVTQECIDELLADATSNIYSAYLETVEMPGEVTYFFSVKEGMEKSANKEVSSYLRSNHTGSTARTLTVNTSIELEENDAEVNTFYVWIIFAVTIMAVVIIYVLQMQTEVKRIVRMRSIGASKRQLRLLIFVETMLLCLPAMILGTALGSLGVWALLRISSYSGSASIVVSIPWNYLLISAAVWIAGVLIIRMITFQIALATPLTGRMVMQRSKAKRYGRFRHALVLLMSTLLCISVVFTSFNLAEPLYNFNYWSSMWTYYLWVNNYQNYSVDTPVTDELISTITSVEGISGVTGISSFIGYISFENADPVYLYVHIMDSDELENYTDISGIDTEAYDNGESIIIQYSDNDNFDSVAYVDDKPAANLCRLSDSELLNELQIGSTVTISIDYGNGRGIVSSTNLESDSIISVSATLDNIEKVGKGEGLQKLNDKLGSRSSFLSSTNYAIQNYNYSQIICSRAFAQKIVDQLPDGKHWDLEYSPYSSEDSAEYMSAYIYTDANANTYATDAAMVNVAHDNRNLSLVNRQEYVTSNTQIYRQSVIMLLVSGICIAAVVLLILLSTLRLEAEGERRHYGILQAIGMSKRQRNLEIIRKSAVRGIISVTTAVVCYLGYYLMMNASALAEGASPISLLNSLFTTLATYGLTAPALALILIALFLVIFLICFISKLGLNKYSIMDMMNTES